MKRIGMFLLCCATCLEASSWTLDRAVLEERLPPGVTTEELLRVLKLEGIDVSLRDSPDTLLWKGDRTSISLARTPFSPYHLWIEVEGRKTLDECTAEELGDLYEAIWKGRKALGEATGADGFMILATEQKRNGKNRSAAGFEIIPAGFGGTDGVMDAVEKNALNEYLLYNRFPNRTVEQSPEVIAALRERLRTLEYVLEREDTQPCWTQKFTHHEEALHQSLEVLYDSLVQLGALVEGEMPSMVTPAERIHEIQINLDCCALCNPKVIQKQLVSDWKGVEILMNHKPVSPYRDFLIIPKRHQCVWDLSREEAIATLEAIVAFKKMYIKTVGSNEWICYIQDGRSVGQTVPHANVHFFIIPDRLVTAISGLQHIHNQRPILSYEEMRADCERLKPLLLEELGR